MKWYTNKAIDVGRRHKYIMRTYMRVLIILDCQVSDHKSVHFFAIKGSVFFNHSLISLPNIISSLDL